ncbi:MAG: thermonuclease family protein [Clostridia bacterium]|nr:thermonuclease family protein [Clostridia bacterium]MDD4376051.1 thermonuclease family protein [Clostridia bacterium]
MYYEDKKKFYLKQYGPAVIIVIISLMLITGGIYLTTKYVDKSENDLLAIKNDNKKDNNQKEKETDKETIKEVKSVTTEKDIPSDLNKLEAHKKSKEYTVYSVNSEGTVTLDLGNKKYFKVNLIGIEYSIKYPNLKDFMQKDLKNKKVKVEFDNNKEENNETYVYLYLNDELYNSKILKNGCATLRVERNNISKLATLLEAEKDAKKANLGIWK